MSAAAESPLEYAVADGIARIRLNRPHRLNAVTTRLVMELTAALRRAEVDEARAVIVAGRGRAFCSGYDLKEPDPDPGILPTQARIEAYQDVTRAIRRCPGIVIAAVHGYALGAGCEIALGCDLVIAAEDAQFGFPEVGIGLSVTGGISQLLPATVGLVRAKELLLLGERFDARRAESLGLINKVVAAGEHEAAANAWAAIIASRPSVATAIGKQALDRGIDATLEQALGQEINHSVILRAENEASVFDD